MKNKDDMNPVDKFVSKWLFNVPIIMIIIIFVMMFLMNSIEDKKYNMVIQQCIDRNYDGYIGMDSEFGYCYKWAAPGKKIIVDEVMFMQMQEEIEERMSKIN